MPRKAFQVQVEIEIQAVTCPGVWLCPNGKVSVQLYMLDSCIQTASVSPVFPLLIHEKFLFFKTYYTAQTLAALQRVLKNEIIYAELIQWQNCEIGSVLASFETTVAELLYPTMQDGAVAGTDIDLLMEPEKHFPGIIAPKLEVSTKTTVEERHCREDSKDNNAFVVNPKVLTSQSHEKSSHGFRQRKVCHSTGYHRKQHIKKRQNEKPPFIVKKVEDGLLARKPKGIESQNDICTCSKHKNTRRLFDRIWPNKEEDDSRDASPSSRKPYITSKMPRIKPRHNINTESCICTCGHHHTQQNCPVCAKYKRYFNSNQESPEPESNRLSVREKIERACPQSARMAQLCCTSNNNDVIEDIQSFRSHTKRCDCSGNCSRACFCPSTQKRTTLAEKLHDRLNRTLGPCVECTQHNLATIYEQNCPPDIECQCGGFSTKNALENFDKFYKNLYQTLTCKSIDTNRYITSC